MVIDVCTRKHTYTYTHIHTRINTYALHKNDMILFYDFQTIIIKSIIINLQRIHPTLQI